MKKLKEIISTLSKKQKIITFISILLIIGIIFVIEELAFPRLDIKNMEKEYSFDDFMTTDIKISSSLFVPKSKTIWSMNGYEFAIGKKHGGLPVNLGENTLKITNGNMEKTYVFNIINDEQSKILINTNLPKVDADNIDYDGDGIANIKEKELGLATYTNDTDNDGLLDNVELIMGLDPTKKDNYNEVREYKVIQDNSKSTQNYLMVNGKGNIANTFLDTADLNLGFDNNFVKSDVLSIVTSNSEKPKNMTLYMKKKYDMNVENYSIYSYDDLKGKLNKLKTIESGDYFLAETKIFNNLYFIGNKETEPTGEYINQIMILLDNSGSMYPAEYVAEKLEKEIPEEEFDEYGNDIEFKRLSLMNSLVSRLGNEKYEYSVYGFTGELYDIVEKSKDIKKVKDGINALKNNYQEFNGTALSDAIRHYSSKFNKNVYGKKYMIVLTDGNDAGLFTFKIYDSTLESYKKQGINIITIGLGKDVNSEYLMKIASKTGGKYLYATDANMLETLIELIESSIQSQEIEKIDGEEVTLIADSGFEVAKDGFSFINFGSSGDAGDGGNCYGFAQLSKDIYLNDLKESEIGKKVPYIEDMVEYTLTPRNKRRLVKGNTYNIKLSNIYNEILNTVPDRNIIKERIPYVIDEYKNKIEGTGAVVYIEDISPDYKVSFVDGERIEYSKYESVILDLLIDIDEIDKKYQDDYQILQLINRYQISQIYYLANLAIEEHKENIQGNEYDYETEVLKMINEIKTGAPALLSINGTIGGHSILANKVYKSNDLENYYVCIYDSNFPGEEVQMLLERQTSYKEDTETSYYSFKYEEDIYNCKWSSMIYCGEI